VAVRGRDRWENLSHAGGPKAAPPVRFGDYVVPAAAAWIVEPVGTSPAVRAEFEMRKGAPVCTSIEVTATPNGRPVMTADLESLPGLDKKGAEAFKNLAIEIIDDEQWAGGRNLDRTGRIFNPDRRAVADALRGHSNDDLSTIAQIYRDNINGAPTEEVQLYLGVSRRTADRRIREARDRGFLPGTTRGKRKA
jgi:hypothetical protein